MSAATHACPVCRAPGVAYRYATCRVCWRQVPDSLRIWLAITWRNRVSQPQAHAEAMVELLMWARDQRAVRSAN